MTLSINCRGSPAFLYFTGIGVILLSKFDVIFQDLCKFPEMFLIWIYLFGILKTQGSTFLSYF